MDNITKTEKLKSMEKESNITLVSTSVAIISFFILVYAQSIVKTNYLKAQAFLATVDITYAICTVGVAAAAITKKEKWLWEYAVFGLVMSIGYYFLLFPGVSGLPFLYKETENSLVISQAVLNFSKVLRTTNVIYALWAINVIYCVIAIALHSVKYNKIKNNKQKNKPIERA